MPGVIASLSSPAQSVMSNLRFSTKFTLVSIIFLIPLLLSLILLQREYSRDIEFSETEKVGLSIIATLQKEQLAIATAAIRGTPLTNAVQLDTHSLPEVSQKRIAEALARYRTAIKDQPNDAQSVLSSLMQTVADQTNLELDQSLDSSYLITTLVNTVPQLQEQLVSTATLGRQVLVTGSFTPDTYIGLSNANQKLPLFIENVDRSVRVALAENTSVRAALANPWARLQEQLVQYHNTVSLEILDPDSFATNTSNFTTASLNSSSAIAEFAKQAQPALATLLDDRINDATFKNRLVISVAIVAVLLAFYLFLGMYFSVTDTVARVVNAVHAIAGGDLSTRVKVCTKDEMRAIATDLNSMTSNLEQLVKRLSEAATTLSGSAASLKTITTQTIDGVHQQQQETARISESMGMLTEVASKVDNNSETASQSSIEAEKEAHQSLILLGRLQSVMQEMQTESSRSQTALNRLVEDSKDIGQVSSAINEIAEQTNLLALNAAIEAARAGEQGRGFAVVADEVRTLAQRTQAQTNQIHDIITRLQQATSETYQSMEQSREQMNLSVTEAEVVGKALKRISEVVSTINKMNTEISQSATEQSNVTQAVADQVESIAAISQAAKGGAEQTDNSAEQLLSVVKTLEQELSALQKGTRAAR
ncbi:methyl-accepting chemotaxis protein [Alteromonas oceanisediminis]|uniref:methyl-accepting chemotaxis protein n=1 Tax=Alteromonas oceanisediminis TaxID=2836180 RepID=UPI001BD951B7|nr:methyl-accepting chemotaxis protein [Alteromonas oceanisediminis]MBT0586767.1 methyl-accepting chemotaxis protein [Alteromonas oceanisediminis]